MHGCIDSDGLATSHGTDGAGVGRGPAERPHAGALLVASRALHGAGLAEPLEPTPAGRARAHTPPPVLGGVGAPRSHAAGDEGEAGDKSRVASVGQRACDSPAALRPQEQAPLVGTPVSTGAVLGLLQKQQHRCALTGRQLTPQTAALDHIVPIRCGGAHIIENTQVLHKDVNRSKGSMTNGAFVAMCGEVVRWAERLRHGQVEVGDGQR